MGTRFMDLIGTTPVRTYVAESPCSTDNSTLCQYVHDVTGSAWLAKASNWMIAKPLSILLLILIGIIVRWLMHRAIDKVAQRAAEGSVPTVLTRNKMSQLFLEHHAQAAERRAQRAQAMAGLLKSVTTGIIATVVVFMIIAQLGYNIAPLIASAGILGVALAFGAQNLVKDFISGIFMILEDQFGVGDVVQMIGGPINALGKVEAVGLRVTRLSDAAGTVWYVRNGEILAVGNRSQEAAVVVLDVSLDPGDDVEKVRAAINVVMTAMRIEGDYRELIFEAPEVSGPVTTDSGQSVLRIEVTTSIAEQSNVAGAVIERLVDRFEVEGLHMPDHGGVVWHSELFSD